MKVQMVFVAVFGDSFQKRAFNFLFKWRMVVISSSSEGTLIFFFSHKCFSTIFQMEKRCGYLSHARMRLAHSWSHDFHSKASGIFFRASSFPSCSLISGRVLYRKKPRSLPLFINGVQVCMYGRTGYTNEQIELIFFPSLPPFKNQYQYKFCVEKTGVPSATKRIQQNHRVEI